MQRSDSSWLFCAQGEESAEAGEHRPLVFRPALPMVPVDPGRPHHHPFGDVGALA
jgi:hypothetical protein